MQQGREQESCAPSAPAGPSAAAVRMAATIEHRRAQDEERARQVAARKQQRRRAQQDKNKRALRLGSASRRDVARVMRFVTYRFDVPWPEADPAAGLPRLTNNHRLVFLFVMGCQLAGFHGLHTTIDHIADRFDISPSTVKEAFRRLATYGLVVKVNNHDAAHAERYGLPARFTQMANTYRVGALGDVLLARARSEIEHRRRCKDGRAEAPAAPSRPARSRPSSGGTVRSGSPYKGGENRLPIPSVEKSLEERDPAKESAPPTDPGGLPPSNPTTSPLPRRRLTGAGIARSGPTSRPRRAEPAGWRNALASVVSAFERRSATAKPASAAAARNLSSADPIQQECPPIDSYRTESGGAAGLRAGAPRPAFGEPPGDTSSKPSFSRPCGRSPTPTAGDGLADTDPPVWLSALAAFERRDRVSGDEPQHRAGRRSEHVEPNEPNAHADRGDQSDGGRHAGNPTRPNPQSLRGPANRRSAPPRTIRGPEQLAPTGPANVGQGGPGATGNRLRE